MEIPLDDLAIFDDDSRWRVMPGVYEIHLGDSSVDYKLETAVEVR